MPTTELEIKIGLSAQDKAAMKTEILDELRGIETPEIIEEDEEVGGIRFYEGELRGTPIGNLAGHTLMTFKQDGSVDYGTMLRPTGDESDTSFYLDDDMILLKDVPVYKKGTSIQLHDLNGNALVSKEVYFKRACFQIRTGEDNIGKYEDILFRKQPKNVTGFNYHNAHRISGNSNAFKEYFGISRYALSKVSTLEEVDVYISKAGEMPVKEIRPDTVIDPSRDGDSEGVAFEWNYVALLYALCFGCRAAGSSAYGADNTVLRGTDLDTKGYTLNTTYGNDASNATNSFFVQNSSAYANLEIGDEVVIDENVYQTSANAKKLTITAKTVGATYTEFTFSGDAVVCGSKLLHIAFRGITGAFTDGIDTLCGENRKFPVGYRPYKIFGIENFFNDRTWCDSLCWNNYQLRRRGANQQAAQYSSFEVVGVEHVIGQERSVRSLGALSPYRDANGRIIYNVPLDVAGASTSTNYCSTTYFENNASAFAIMYGTSKGDTVATGLFSCSSSNYSGGHTWTTVAGSGLASGCWGRSFRSVKRRNASEL